MCGAASGGIASSNGSAPEVVGACHLKAFILVPELPASITRTYCVGEDLKNVEEENINHDACKKLRKKESVGAVVWDVYLKV